LNSITTLTSESVLLGGELHIQFAQLLGLLNVLLLLLHEVLFLRRFVFFDLHSEVRQMEKRQFLVLKIRGLRQVLLTEVVTFELLSVGQLVPTI